MTKHNYSIGVDLGGTNIAVGLLDIGTRKIVQKMSVKTNAPRPCEEISEDIVEVCNKLCALQEITLQDVLWIGVATPGIVKARVVVSAVNLGWKNVDFGKILEDISHRPTYVVNDANAAAYAEAMWGVGQDANSVMAFTIGTGVGGGIVINKKIWEGTNGFAAEMGHMVLVPGGRQCACGKKGCIEVYCSASALVRQTISTMLDARGSLMWKEVQGDINRVNGKTAFKAMKAGDEAAKRVVDAFIECLGLGISNVINVFQPDVICIGGGMSREGEVLMAPLRKHVHENSFGTDDSRTKIVAATFENDAGIIGAGVLGLQKDCFV